MSSIEFLLINRLYYFPAITTKTSEANDSREGFRLGAGFVDSTLTDKEDMIGWLNLGQQELETATCCILADMKAQRARSRARYGQRSLLLGKVSHSFFSKGMVGVCEGMVRYGEGMVTGKFPLLQRVVLMHLWTALSRLGE